MEVMHTDSLYMGASNTNGLQYMLDMNDDLNQYIWRHTRAEPGTEAAPCALRKWITSFGRMECIVSDPSAHFTAEVMIHIVDDNHFKPYFSGAYCYGQMEKGTLHEKGKSEHLRPYHRNGSFRSYNLHL